MDWKSLGGVKYKAAFAANKKEAVMVSPFLCCHEFWLFYVVLSLRQADNHYQLSKAAI